GVIQSPTAYDPTNHPVAARNRRDLVLRQMLEQGYLQRSVYEESVNQALPAPKQGHPTTQQTIEGIDSGYFTSWVQQQVIERYGAPRAFDGGLPIKTNLAYAAGPTASLVAIETSTGEVRAMVGGRIYNESAFTLATQGQRQ